MGHSTKLLTPTQTVGDIFHDELRQNVSAKLTSVLAQSGIGPIILWGEWALLYYGVPICEHHMHLLVPDDQLEAAYEALLAAGYEDSPPVLLPMVTSSDPNIHWEELGCPAHQVVGDLRHRKSRVKILIQDYSAAAGTFDDADPSSFEQCAGLAIPPLPLLAESFLRAYFQVRGSHSRLCDMLRVWIASVKECGYSPLGVDAMRGVPGIDDAMALYWERGY
ncbi:uncharacterized protein LAESUDRAFT_751460 [Laetiporus sulphureus 93-53]|uniref:Uncharacterized protein n=1 Tax=Laetiporus sulphureus 93-53 TaxID=1314785 RepID=A0A165D057_9APHY|nr:uncharacterized protein LAESUDRAFT_751460 [Laetiporus sulphureus 93-53]KZT03869.1 hypothetical protein LAESUDRAFT_751460 [Laetiporus sulphureus 93-53]